MFIVNLIRNNYRFLFAFCVFLIFVLSTYSSISNKINKNHDKELITYIHNKSIVYISELLSYENCHGRITTSFAYRLARELHQKNDLYMEFEFIKQIEYQNLVSYSLVLTTQDLKKNLKSFSYGYLFSNRSSNKCFGIIY